MRNGNAPGASDVVALRPLDIWATARHLARQTGFRDIHDMAFIRAIGCLFLIPAILMLSYGLVIWHDGVPLFELAARDYLAMVGPAAPDPVQVAAQRFIPGALADPRSAAFLLWPVAGAIGFVAALLSVPGMIILVLFRRGWSRALVRRQYS